MTELTPRDDIRKTISEILKRVDQLLKVGEIEQGMREIIRAKEMDPKNIYIHAYEERINFLKQEHERHQHEELTRKQAEEAARKRDEEQRKKLEEEWKKQEEERRKKQAEEDQRKKEEEEKRRIEENIRKEQDASRLLEKQQGPESTPPPKKNKLEVFTAYKQTLKEVWSDGVVTDDEEASLKRLSAELNISVTEHVTLEKEVKLEAYLSAFKRAWTTGSITPEATSALADLRKKFQITPEEREQIEGKILWELRTGREQAKLVVIDDDQKFLGVVTETLQDAGFQVRAFTSSDDAFKFLQDETPDLIVSDINLETSTMGGFTFYEKVRELDHLAEVPFIFLSGLTDEVLIRTGKELGVDDYLTKPFSDETLVATIKGKLKRFKQLKKAQKKK